MNQNIAAIIPFRDRYSHLSVLVPKLKVIVPHIDLFVIEQCGNDSFNRGAIKNIGAMEAKGYGAYCFHDVDFIPMQADYSYSDNPVAMVTERNGAPMYKRFFGGVVMVPTKKLWAINGYSNRFKTWSCEDDRMRHDLVTKGYKIEVRQNKYEHLEHTPFDGWNTPEYQAQVNYMNGERDKDDGMFQVKYVIEFITQLPDYKHIGISIL